MLAVGSAAMATKGKRSLGPYVVYDPDFVERMNAARKAKAWNWKRLADEVGADPSSMSPLKRPFAPGDEPRTSRLITAIAKALEIEMPVPEYLREAEALRRRIAAARDVDPDLVEATMTVLDRMLPGSK